MLVGLFSSRYWKNRTGIKIEFVAVGDSKALRRTTSLGGVLRSTMPTSLIKRSSYQQLTLEPAIDATPTKRRYSSGGSASDLFPSFAVADVFSTTTSSSTSTSTATTSTGAKPPGVGGGGSLMSMLVFDLAETTATSADAYSTTATSTTSSATNAVDDKTTRVCSMCGTSNTPQWRRKTGGGLLCNGCGLKHRRAKKRAEKVRATLKILPMLIFAVRCGFFPGGRLKSCRFVVAIVTDWSRSNV